MWRPWGEARRANLKRKDRYITLSVAETYAYCTLNTVSIEMLDTFCKSLRTCVSVVVFCICLLFHVHGMQSPIQHAIIYFTRLTIFLNILMHILHIYCPDAYTCFQDDFCPEDVLYSSLPTLSKNVLRTMLPDVELNEISLHEGEKCTCDSDLACQTLKLAMRSCRNGLWSTTHVVPDWSRWCSGPPCCKTWTGWIFLISLRNQGSEQRPAKRAFGCAN